MDNLSRRAVMGGAAALPALLAAPAAAASVSAWDAALARFDAAYAAYDAASDLEDEALGRIHTEVGKFPSLVWHAKDPLTGDEVSWVVSEKTLRAQDHRPGTQGHDLLASIDDWRARFAAASKRADYDGLTARSSALFDEFVAAETALMNTPAPHLEALTRKLQIVSDELHNDEAREFLDLVMADAQRLAMKGAA